jgi:hypothetical protein
VAEVLVDHLGLPVTTSVSMNVFKSDTIGRIKPHTYTYWEIKNSQ